MTTRTVKAYGLLNNRFEEGRNFNPDKLIHVGDDITMYYYSDRNCYYVTEVIDQKHIKVKRYHVCADHDKKGGMGHQDWMYFKTKKEENEYLSKFFPDREYDLDPQEDEPEEWFFRYNTWKYKGVDNKYHNLSGKISFGVRDYHYDWEY